MHMLVPLQEILYTPPSSCHRIVVGVGKNVIQSARDNRRGQYATLRRQPQGKNKRTKQSFSPHI